MFDLSLFRLPTFTGGAVAAFGMSASIFALLLYLVLYIQDILGYDALGTGLRLIVMSGGILLTSTIAGRLTSHVPVRFLIGPGLFLVGIGLLLMRGLDAGSTVDAPDPGDDRRRRRRRVGQPAAGLDRGRRGDAADGRGWRRGSTRRSARSGIATGIALLGTLFSSKVHDEVMSLAAGVPALSPHGGQIATAVQSGQLKSVLGGLPGSAAAQAGEITKSAFTAGLNQILLIAAIIALVSGVIAISTIRSKDFAQQH